MSQTLDGLAQKPIALSRASRASSGVWRRLPESVMPVLGPWAAVRDMEAAELLGGIPRRKEASPEGVSGDWTDGATDARIFWQARSGSHGGDAKAKVNK